MLLLLQHHHQFYTLLLLIYTSINFTVEGWTVIQQQQLHKNYYPFSVHQRFVYGNKRIVHVTTSSSSLSSLSSSTTSLYATKLPPIPLPPPPPPLPSSVSFLSDDTTIPSSISSILDTIQQQVQQLLQNINNNNNENNVITTITSNIQHITDDIKTNILLLIQSIQQQLVSLHLTLPTTLPTGLQPHLSFPPTNIMIPNVLPTLRIPLIIITDTFNDIMLKNGILDGINEIIASSSSSSSITRSEDITTIITNTITTLQEKYNNLYQISSTTTTTIPLLEFVVATIVTYTIATTWILPTSTSSSSSNSNTITPYPMNQYNAETARYYFDRKPLLVLSRAYTIFSQSTQFILSIVLDYIQKKVEINESRRGQELAIVLTKLGPTFIKVGQSLSIRTDLLSPAYIRGLETLQDQVPPFPTSIAKQILEQEWGQSISNILSDTELSTTPIAAASLGQVYKAKLRTTNEEVAIKIQRPAIMEQIALDMYLIREIGSIIKRITKANTDIVGTVDAWGRGFIDELDYIQEAQNGENFSKMILDTPLKDVVFAPTVLSEYTTRKVLVSSWVNGVRLDRSDSKDVSVICSIAMNTYLTMLLEFGLLHCDPHPGNLLRTNDGKLCIMDWGMVTRLDPDLQLTLIEHMAHLTSADYAELPRDLLLLGFVPEDKADVIGDSGVVEVLADIYGAWTAGGGAAAINVNAVIAQLQDLTAKKGNLFRIPPYFAYIAKSFSVLEGIGLSNDPKYSIINECLPYVSKRLLTDKDTMGPALSTFIFGPDKYKSDRIINYKRVEQLIEGFGEYTLSASGSLLGKVNLSRSEILDDIAEQVLDLVFTETETPLQQIFLEQMAKIISSTGRVVLTQLREQTGILPSGRTRLGVLLDPFGLWRTSPLVRANELDEQTIETTIKLVSLLQRQIQLSGNNELFDLSKLSREEVLELGTILVRKVWVKRNGVVQTTNRFARKLLQLTADKLEKGERDSRRLPSLLPTTTESTMLTQSLQSSSPSSSIGTGSERLQSARKILMEAQEQELLVQQ